MGKKTEIDVEHKKFNDDRVQKKQSEVIVKHIGRFNSTNDFVNSLDLHNVAAQVLGVAWEPEFDAEQIQAMLEFLHPDMYHVYVLEEVDENDIVVTYAYPETFVEKIKTLEKELERKEAVIELLNKIIKSISKN